MFQNNFLKIGLILIIACVSCIDKKHNHQDVYICPMHPEIQMDHEDNCPICGMKLVKKEQNLEDSISLSVEKQNLIGIQLSKVEMGNIQNTLSFSGKVAYDPDLFSVFAEYREILQNPSISGGGLLQNFRSRMIKLGLSEDQISYVSKRSPNVFLTGRAGGKVLLIFQVYEIDIQSINKGTKVLVRVDSYQGKEFKGDVVATGNLVDEKSRTLSVWCEVNDIEQKLKPQMFVEVNTIVQKTNVLNIPKDAILPTGKRKIVYKKLSENQFIAQEIKEGFSSNDKTEILEGLEEGDVIVSRANFLLDSEAKLKSGIFESNIQQNQDKMKGEVNDTHNH